MSTVDQKLARAIRRAEDKRTATERLTAANAAVAAPIGAAAATAGLTVSIRIGEDLDDETGTEDVPYYLEANRNGEVYVGVAALDRNYRYTQTVSSREEDSSWIVTPDDSERPGWKTPPRHIAILVAYRLADLASALEEKAERLASETEAALEAVTPKS